MALPWGVALGAPTSLCPVGHHTLQAPGPALSDRHLRVPTAHQVPQRPQLIREESHPRREGEGQAAATPRARVHGPRGWQLWESASFRWALSHIQGSYHREYHLPLAQPFPLQCGRPGFNPWGRSPGEGKGYLLQYSGLENSMDCIDHVVAKSWTRLTLTHFL